MKACVIGGGPSGLYVSDYLTRYGFNVELFEKGNSLLGNYRYARDKTDAITRISLNPNIKLHLNSDESAADDASCDFYVLATGAVQKELDIDGKQYLTKAIDLIKEYYDSGRMDINGNVCIIGMGNVALDLIHYLKDSARSITVLGRSSLENAAFDNHVMRGIIDSDYFDISLVNVDPKWNGEDTMSRRSRRRYEMFKDQNTMEISSVYNKMKEIPLRLMNKLKTLLHLKNHTSSLSFIFKAVPSSIVKENGSLRLDYLLDGKMKSDLFDSIISSVGFVPNIPEIPTGKKVYRTGWCNNPRGNIGDSKLEARDKAKEIAEELLELS